MGGLHRGSILVSRPEAPALIPSIRKIFTDKKLSMIAEVYQMHWFEESGLWLENVDRTHLVLAGGEPASKKICCISIIAFIVSERCCAIQQSFVSVRDVLRAE